MDKESRLDIFVGLICIEIIIGTTILSYLSLNFMYQLIGLTLGLGSAIIYFFWRDHKIWEKHFQTNVVQDA